MSKTFICWKCGSNLVDVILPLPRLAECPTCRAQLHVCRMCEYFDPSLGQQCREPVAESVTDKQRANFCGYFQITAYAYSVKPDKAAEARRQLDEMFGNASAPSASEQSNPADAAREQLENLFKK